MAQAAAEAEGWQEALDRTGHSVLMEALRSVEAFEPDEHDPAGDVLDVASGACHYHCHHHADRPAHGHLQSRST